MPIFYTESGFLKAVARGDLELIDKYFAHGGKEKWVALKREHGLTPLHHAAYHEEPRAVKKLVEAGANLEAVNSGGLTPLGYAITHRQGGAIKAMIDAGANVNALANGATLLSVAVNNYFEAGFKILLENKADPNDAAAMRNAMQRNYRDMIMQLLKAGATPEKTDLGKELLHYAAQNNNIELAKEMLSRGVDVNALNDEGWTALHFAAYRDKKEMVDFLLEQKARYDLKNSDGRTPQALAEYYSHGQVVHKIKSLEEEVAAKNATPLNATGNRMPDNSAETWVMMGENQIARVGIYPAVGRRLTHIFNFESRERIIISENLKTAQESVTQPEKFDTLEQGHLEKALAAFRQAGGSVTDAQVFGATLAKKTLAGPG